MTAYVAYSLYVDVPKGFFPDEDTGFLRGITEAQPDTSFREMSLRQVTVSDLVCQGPRGRVRDLRGRLRRRDQQGLPVHQAEAEGDRGSRLQDHGAPARARRRSSPASARIMLPVQNLEFTGGRIARAKYQYTLQSGDIDTLYKMAPVMEREIAQLPGLRDVNTDLQISNPQTRVDIDRDKAAAFGVTTDEVRNALYNAYRHPADLDDLHRGRRLRGDPRGVGGFPERHRRARPHPRLDARPASSCRSTKSRPCGARSGRCRSTGSRSSRR